MSEQLASPGFLDKKDLYIAEWGLQRASIPVV